MEPPSMIELSHKLLCDSGFESKIDRLPENSPLCSVAPRPRQNFILPHRHVSWASFRSARHWMDPASFCASLSQFGFLLMTDWAEMPLHCTALAKWDLCSGWLADAIKTALVVQEISRKICGWMQIFDSKQELWKKKKKMSSSADSVFNLEGYAAMRLAVSSA